jgi:hypothetical protein
LEISKELLLQDYRYRSESLWKSEQAGETRVQLFIGFVTAVGAGLGLFVKENLASGETLRFVVLADHGESLGEHAHPRLQPVLLRPAAVVVDLVQEAGDRQAAPGRSLSSRFARSRGDPQR